MITKAIIPVAGWGTRRLPITKAIEKCMLPVGNRPVVDYVVQDCIAAGITDIYFIVGEQSTQLHDFYRTNIDLNDYLRRAGKQNLLPSIAPPKASLHYIVQSSYGKYGTAIPVGLAFRELADGESAVVLMGDDFTYNPHGQSDIQRLIEASAGVDGAMLGAQVPKAEVYKYGLITTNQRQEFTGIVEKPSVETAVGTLVNISKYVLSYPLLKAIYEFTKTEHDGEYYIIDPINQYVAGGGTLRVVTAAGQYLDCGTVEGWLRANNTVLAKTHCNGAAPTV